MFVILMKDHHKSEKQQVVVMWHEGKPQSKREEVFSDNLHASKAVSEKEKGRPELWFPISPDLGDRFT